MAGTSADGIDAAIIRVAGSGLGMRIRFVHHYHVPFERRLRQRLLSAMAPAATTTEEIALLHAKLGEAFGEAAKQAIQQVGKHYRPCVIGLAGQTLCHLPGGRGRRTVTLQLGSAAHVAAVAGVPVVSDFRQSDVAAGGQGAPLVPWTDWVLFHDKYESRAIQNIGGIGNVTWLPAGGTAENVVAFDTGPGNMIIDEIVARATTGRHRMDRDGKLALKGRVIEAVLSRWMRHPFLSKKPPRTTGRETFGKGFVDQQWPLLVGASPRVEDWVATATAFTARTIAASYCKFIPSFKTDVERRNSVAEDRIVKKANHARNQNANHGRANNNAQLVLTGGGSRNRALRQMLATELPGTRIVRIDDLGIPDQSKEAVSFAMLAVSRLDGVASNLPQATGATYSAILGGLNAI